MADPFVSLDQAQDIALGHARDNLDFHGRRYRRREMAWEVLSQEEREDAYHVRLSYGRPAPFGVSLEWRCSPSAGPGPSSRGGSSPSLCDEEASWAVVWWPQVECY